MKAISFPFTLAPTGEALSTSTLSKIYLDRLYTLLGTQVGQRPMNPTYGVDLASALFENENDFALAIRVAITSAVKLWLPQVNVEEIQVKDPNQTGYAEVTLSVTLPNQKLTQITVSSAIFGANGLIESAV